MFLCANIAIEGKRITHINYRPNKGSKTFYNNVDEIIDNMLTINKLF